MPVKPFKGFNTIVRSVNTQRDKHTPLADLRGCKGCVPWHPNSFDHMQFSGNFGKIMCFCPPPFGELVPHLGEILDPLLHTQC